MSLAKTFIDTVYVPAGIVSLIGLETPVPLKGPGAMAQVALPGATSSQSLYVSKRIGIGGAQGEMGNFPWIMTAPPPSVVLVSAESVRFSGSPGTAGSGAMSMDVTLNAAGSPSASG